jgi:hypothetical protein
MTIVDPFARNRPPYVDPYNQSLVLEEADTDWRVMVLAGGEDLVLDQWTSLAVSDTPDGPRCTLEVNGLDPMIVYMRMMTTDVRLYRNNRPLYRLKIADATDTLTRDAHIVSFECVGYEKLLERRVLHEGWVLADEDIDAAWRLIDYTQRKFDLGIRRGTIDPGVPRQRSLNIGDTILDSVNDFAESDTGFDWWIDHDLLWWAQKPRRGRVHDVEWRWGGAIAEMTRTSQMDDYASLVVTTGAQNETRIPDPPNPDIVYPPPNPAIVSLTAFPIGLWERTVSYSDVITDTSLLEKANWHLADFANVRPTYKLTLEPGWWTPDYGIGDVVTMRVEGAPRINFRVPVRIEELGITITADGEETVNVSVRAEEPETMLTPLPLPNIDPVLPIPTGRTVQRNRLRPWDDLAALLRNTNDRLQRQERSPGA